MNVPYYRIWKRTKLVVLFFFTWFTIHTCYTIYDGLNNYKKSADIAVILGNKVNRDGTLSTRLQKRLDCGILLFKQSRIKAILVSGGLGYEGFYEGDKMKDYLVINGIPEESILVDNNGNNTISTVENTLKLRDKLKFKSIMVVSQYFHITRTKMLFRRRNFTQVTSQAPRYFELRDVHSLIREFIAFYVQLF